MKDKRGNGEGSLYYDEKKKRYVGAISVGNGQRKFFYGKKKKDVVNKMNELKSDLQLGQFVGTSSLTIEEYLLKKIETEKRKNLIKETTYKRKIETLKAIQRSPIASRRIQSVSAAEIDEFLISLTSYSDSYIRKVYGLLNNAFNDNIPNLIKVSPMKDIKRPRSEQKKEKTRALTLAEQKNLLDVLNSEKVKYKEQMLIMLNTGMRMGEINALAPQDVNLKFKTVEVRRTVTKDNKDRPVIGQEAKTDAGRRLIPLSNATQAIFSDILLNYTPNNLNLLFTANSGVISTNQVNMEFNRLCDNHNIVDKEVKGKVSLHSLRHTYATRAIESGMSALVLKELLGHTDIKITLNTYCDAFEQFKTEDINKVETYLQQKFS